MNTPTTANGAATKKTTATAAPIAGVGLHGAVSRLLRRDVMLAAAAKMGFEVGPDWSDDQAALAIRSFVDGDLAKQQASGKAAADIASFNCTECRGLSTDATDYCPYCGEGGDFAPLAVASGVAQGSAEAPPPPEPVSLDDVLGTTPAAPPSDPGAIDATKMSPEALPEPAAPKKRGPKKAEVPPRAEPATPSAAIVTAAPVVEAEVVSPAEGRLDARVAVIKSAQNDEWIAFYRKGQALLAIFNDEDWKTRVSRGKQKYTTFEQFTNAELGMAPDEVYNHMDSAKALKENEAGLLGKTKSFLFLRATPELKAVIKDRIEKKLADPKGAPALPSARAMEKEVVEANEKRGAKTDRLGRERQPAKEKKPGPKKKAKSAKGMLTIAQFEGRDVVALMVDGRQVQSEKKLERAVATLSSFNDQVLTTHRIEKRAKGFVLVIDRKRVED